jgi:hypothetical protein
MQKLMNLILMLTLTSSTGSLLGSRLVFAATGQQNEEPNASPQQETPSAQGQASSHAAVQSVTGCVVKSDNGYSLKTKNDSYPIETGQDLSRYVDKEVRVTGILEHQNASTPSATAGSTATITDIRLRMVATVIGDCNHSEK